MKYKFLKREMIPNTKSKLCSKKRNQLWYETIENNQIYLGEIDIVEVRFLGPGCISQHAEKIPRAARTLKSAPENPTPKP